MNSDFIAAEIRDCDRRGDRADPRLLALPVSVFACARGGRQPVWRICIQL